jgi:hypothetical protein
MVRLPRAMLAMGMMSLALNDHMLRSMLAIDV